MVPRRIYNGYSSEVTGSITILYGTPQQVGGVFDFSAPTEGRTPNFTVRIHGAFLTENHPDPERTCS
jgi:hypothetical protein